MRHIRLAAAVVAVAILLPGVRMVDSGLELSSVAHAQMFKPEVQELDGGTPAPTASNSRMQTVSAALREFGDSVRRQSANLFMSLFLAVMMLILIGAGRVSWSRQRQGQSEPLCACGLRRGHCIWCRQGGS